MNLKIDTSMFFMGSLLIIIMAFGVLGGIGLISKTEDFFETCFYSCILILFLREICFGFDYIKNSIHKGGKDNGRPNTTNRTGATRTNKRNEL